MVLVTEGHASVNHAFVTCLHLVDDFIHFCFWVHIAQHLCDVERRQCSLGLLCARRCDLTAQHAVGQRFFNGRQFLARGGGKSGLVECDAFLALDCGEGQASHCETQIVGRHETLHLLECSAAGVRLLDGDGICGAVFRQGRREGLGGIRLVR